MLGWSLWCCGEFYCHTRNQSWSLQGYFTSQNIHMTSDVCFLVHSQDLGPDDCTANVSLTTGATTIEIPPGTVCVQCIINGEVVDDAQFQLQGSNIDPSKGRTVDGVLVLFQTENVFVPNASPTLRCFSSSGSTMALVIFLSKSYT